MKFILTLSGFFVFYFMRAIPAHAVYNSHSRYLTFSFSIAEQNRPQSDIKDLPFQITNQLSVPITVEAIDDSNIKKISLYYSFNFGPWVLFDQAQTNQFQFNFTPQRGDGLYSFYSLATDIYDNVEEKEEDFFSYQLKFDTTPPTSNLVIPNVTLPASTSAILTKENPSFVQTISLPSSVSSRLGFSFRFQSHDIAEYSFFDIYFTDLTGKNILEKVLTYGNLDSSNLSHDSGWLHFSRNVGHLAGQVFNLVFKLTDLSEDPDLTSSVEIADLQTHLLDLRTAANPGLDLLSFDLGSDIIAYPTLPLLQPGENIISFSATDSAGNTGTTQNYPLVILPDLVINKVDKYGFFLFNNSLSQTLDLSNLTYSLNNSLPLNIDNIQLPPLQSFTVFFPETQANANLKIIKNSDVLISFNAFDLDNFYWQRQFSGLGPWLKIGSSPIINLESRLSASKITLTISGLATTLPDTSYIIDYQDASGPQQIFGQIFPEQIDENGFVSRDFFLGTCSSGGTCTPAPGLSSKFIVTFSNLPPQEFNFK